MRSLCLLLVPASFLLAAILTPLAIILGKRLSALDAPGVPGQIKAAARPVPNTGGMAIFLTIALPIALGLLALSLGLGERFAQAFPELSPHLPGIRAESLHACVLLGGLSVLHATGLVDDRRPLGAAPKFLVMFAVAGGVVFFTDSRLLTFMDERAGGPWLSIALTVFWIVVVTNALNFLDNMDGLSAGVAAIASACFLAAALIHGQWFVGGTLALLLGALLGFLLYNFPWRERTPHAHITPAGSLAPVLAPVSTSPERERGGPAGARIFMGDSGSLVVGFLLAFLTVRTTYYAPALASGSWYAVFMPLVVLAIPLYDFTSVCLIRLSQGRSPFVGDLQHFSHRLVRRGLSRRDAVLVIYGCTGVTAVGGIALGSLAPWQAALVGVQTLCVLLVIALFEGRSASRP